jgi:hypothetical protein
VLRIGGACGPPPPVRCFARASLRTHFRGDPPRRAGPPPHGSDNSRQPGCPAWSGRGTQIVRSTRMPSVVVRLRWSGRLRCKARPRGLEGPDDSAAKPVRVAWMTRRAWMPSLVTPGLAVVTARGVASRRSGERASADLRPRPSTSRGVAPEVSAQRGTSEATNGGGGPQAPPIRSTCRPQACSSLTAPIRILVRARTCSAFRPQICRAFLARKKARGHHDLWPSFGFC